MKKRLPFLLILLLFCFLLCFPKLSLEASKRGLLLWFDTLLPTLLPFLVLSQLILKTPCILLVEKLFGGIFQKVFHCSKTGAFCAICGFLCGYPVGARLIALQIKEQTMSKEEGQYLLAFCNNVSPMFCISYGILYGIGSPKPLPYLLMLYGSALLFGLFTRPRQITGNIEAVKKQTSSTEPVFRLIDVCIIDSFLILIKLCGYLILFSMITQGLLALIGTGHLYLRTGLAALLEITNGLSYLSGLPHGTLRSAIGIAALSFGGLCCFFQTSSVLSDTPLSLKQYFFDKGKITLIALTLFFCFRFLL